jgi:nitrate/nitrite-specific signal transduction histidine kinase
MEIDVSQMSNKSIKSGIERMLELGRELLQMSSRLEKKYQNVNDEIVTQNRKMMEVI